MAPPDTRTRILDAAEGLFAERGFRGTSVRAITGLAGANLAAVGYHFGSKAELLAAVTRRVTVPIKAAPGGGLDRLRARTPAPVPVGRRAGGGIRGAAVRRGAGRRRGRRPDVPADPDHHRRPG